MNTLRGEIPQSQQKQIEHFDAYLKIVEQSMKMNELPKWCKLEDPIEMAGHEPFKYGVPNVGQIICCPETKFPLIAEERHVELGKSRWIYEKVEPDTMMVETYFNEQYSLMMRYNSPNGGRLKISEAMSEYGGHLDWWFDGYVDCHNPSRIFPVRPTHIRYIRNPNQAGASS